MRTAAELHERAARLRHRADRVGEVSLDSIRELLIFQAELTDVVADLAREFELRELNGG